MDKFKGFFVKGIVLLVNAMLVVGGVFFIKEQSEKKNEIADNSAEEAGSPEDQMQETPIIEEVPQSVEYTAVQKAIIEDQKKKLDQIANNPASKTVQQPKTVTQTIPAKTTTVKVPSTSSSSTKSSTTTTTTAKPKTTTKKSW